MKNQRRFSEQFYHVSATNPSTRQFPTQLYLSSRKTAQRYELTTLSASISQCNLHKPNQNQQQLLHFPALGRNNGCSIQTQISFHPGVESSRLVLYYSRTPGTSSIEMHKISTSAVVFIFLYLLLTDITKISPYILNISFHCQNPLSCSNLYIQSSQFKTCRLKTQVLNQGRGEPELKLGSSLSPYPSARYTSPRRIPIKRGTLTDFPISCDQSHGDGHGPVTESPTVNSRLQ